MQDPKYDWYRADGKALEVITDFFERRKAALQAQLDWMKTFGTTIKYRQGDVILGLILPDPLPEGWTRKRAYPQEVAVPDRSAAGKTLRKAMNTVNRVPGSSDMTCSLGFAMTLGDGWMRSCTSERLGDTWVVGVPVGWLAPGDAHKPVEGLVPLKQSEYWLLKESATTKEPAPTKESTPAADPSHG